MKSSESPRPDRGSQQTGKAAVLASDEKPAVMEIDQESVPQTLKEIDRWSGWRWTWDTKSHKWTKPPVDAKTGRAGSSTNPDKWCSFDDAIAAVQSERCDGIGFVLGEHGSVNFAGADLDDCRDPATGELTEVAREVIGTLNSYCEVSPTQTGVKLLFLGGLPAKAKTTNRARTIELYSKGRYFTITGKHLEGTPQSVEDRQGRLDEVWEKYIGSESSKSKGKRATKKPRQQEPDSDRIFEALDAMLRHKPSEHENDGSRRLYFVACRAVEHNLTDELALMAIRSYERTFPFPFAWSDEDIFKRLRDAEGREDIKRGSAIRPKASKADPGRVAGGIIANCIVDDLSRLRYWNESFWRWSDGKYVEMPVSEIRAQILNDFEKKWSYVKSEHVSNVVEHLRAKTILSSEVVSPMWLNSQFDSFDPRECLSTENSIIHLPSLIERPNECTIPATPAFLTVTACEFALDLNAPTPEAWLRFLNSVWKDDQASIDTLQEIFGYLLTADTRQQKIPLIVGPKRSGKGTIARILRKLVGEGNVAGPTLSGLATPFGLSELVGKSVAIISDARLSNRADQSVVVERLLAISGEDKLTIDRKHRTAIHCQLPTRILIMSNELPRLSDASGTIVTRLLVLHTTNSFYGCEDHGLTEKLTTELPGILVWAIEGWQRLRERGYFVQPDAATESLDEMTDLASPVTAFVRERCLVDRTKTVAIPQLFGAWTQWCNVQGHLPGSAQTFGRNLRAAFSGVKTTSSLRTGDGRTRYYSGLTLAV